MKPRPDPEEAAAPPAPHRDPMHGLTLQRLLELLLERYGWEGLAQRVPIQCFRHEPSIASSLKFLRRTPWARAKVESLYAFMLREARRAGAALPPPGGR